MALISAGLAGVFRRKNFGASFRVNEYYLNTQYLNSRNVKSGFDPNLGFITKFDGDNINGYQTTRMQINESHSSYIENFNIFLTLKLDRYKGSNTTLHFFYGGEDSRRNLFINYVTEKIGMRDDAGLYSYFTSVDILNKHRHNLCFKGIDALPEFKVFQNGKLLSLAAGSYTSTFLRNGVIGHAYTSDDYSFGGKVSYHKCYETIDEKINENNKNSFPKSFALNVLNLV